MSRDTQAKRWCFTINNPTPEQEEHLRNNVESFNYLVYGHETGESGTPHLQGFCILKTKLRFNQVRLLIPGAHLEKAKGTPKQASDYCKKDDDDYFEHGELPATQGKRTDFERLKDWIIECDTTPSHYEIASEFPSLWGRYKRSCINFVELFGPRVSLVEGEFRPWQRHVDGLVNEQADDRKILFVVDPVGGNGKSWLTRYWFSKRVDVQRLSVGKRDDLAFAIDVSKRLFVFDIPRQQSEFLQYGILEQLKDQMVFSPKYESVTKVIPERVHVVVFMNEEPDRNKMTSDRYKIVNINSL